GKSHLLQESIVIDFAKSRAAVFVARMISMVLNAKATYQIDTLSKVVNRVFIHIVHDVAGVIVHPDSGITHFLNDLGSGGPGTNLSTMLFDDDEHARISGKGANLPEVSYPSRVFSRLCATESQKLTDTGFHALFNSSFVCIDCILIGHVNGREHHHRSEAQIRALPGQLTGFGRAVFDFQDGHA